MIRVVLQKKGRLHSFYLPQTWEEINTDALLLISAALLSDSPGNRLAIIRAYLPKDLAELFYTLSENEVYRITSAIDWMYSTWIHKPYISSFKNDKGEIYYLPSAALGNCNILEYIFADKYFEDIRRGDSAKIDYLILSLCRPQRKDYDPESVDYDGNRREKFNEELIGGRVQYLEKVDMRFKLYFLLFFIGCKKTLAQKYAPLFRQADEETLDAVKSPPDFGLVGIVWDLAGGIVNQDKIQFSYLHDIFSYLCKRHYDNLALQKQYDKSSHI